MVGSRFTLGEHRVLKFVGPAFRNCPVTAILYLGGGTIWALLQSNADFWSGFMYWDDCFRLGLAKSEYSIRTTTRRTAALRTTGFPDSSAGTDSSAVEEGLPVTVLPLQVWHSQKNKRLKL